MRYLALLLLLSLPAFADESASKGCVVIKHASVSRQMWVSGANWQYVAGDFPLGMKWKSNITDRNVRKIKELGGKVVVVDQQYTVPELEAAKKECGK